MSYTEQYRKKRENLSTFANEGLNMIREGFGDEKAIAKAMVLADWQTTYSNLAHAMGLSETLDGANPSGANDVDDFLEEKLIPAIDKLPSL